MYKCVPLEDLAAEFKLRTQVFFPILFLYLNQPIYFFHHHFIFLILVVATSFMREAV